MISTGGRRRIVLAGVLAAFAAATPATAREPVAPVPAFGVNGGVLWPDGPDEYDAALHTREMAAAGLRSVRAVAFWDQAEPGAPGRDGPRFDWRRADDIAVPVARAGLRWQAVLCCGSFWGGLVPGFTEPGQLARNMLPYAEAFARRYGRRGTFWKERPELPYAPVTNYQVWNEPNVAGFWPPAPDARRYAELLLALRERILSVDPHARVAVGALSQQGPGDGSASVFLREMLATTPTLRGNLDAVGLTVYARDADGVLDAVARVRHTLDALGERSVPIDLNEVGWHTAGRIGLTDLPPVSEEQRADAFGRLVELLRSSDCGVASVTPYAWATAEDSLLDGAAWLGIADRRTGRPKPSGGAYAAAVRTAARLAPLPDPPCGRPDLPSLDAVPAAAPGPVRVALSRRCAQRRLVVRTGLGPDPEPADRVTIRLPGGATRVLRDPDAGGPRSTPTAATVTLPRRTGRVTVTVSDELGRDRGSGAARLTACRKRR